MAKIKTLMRMKIKAIGDGIPFAHSEYLDVMNAESETEEQEAVRVAKEAAIRAARPPRGKTAIPNRKRYALYQITPRKLQRARDKRLAREAAGLSGEIPGVQGKPEDDAEDDEEEVDEEEEQEEGDGDWDKELAAPDARMQQLMAEYAKTGGGEMGKFSFRIPYILL
jgi:hypothetical protein